METNVNRSATPSLTFLFSLVPGAGHMYMGLMRRGLEIMFAFFASIFILSSTLQLPEIGVPLTIVLYFYSLFDAQHLNKALIRGETVSDHGMLKIPFHTINGYQIGVGIMILGVLFLLNRLKSTILYLNIPYPIINGLERSIAPLLIMGIGFYLILKSKKTPQTSQNDE